MPIYLCYGKNAIKTAQTSLFCKTFEPFYCELEINIHSDIATARSVQFTMYIHWTQQFSSDGIVHGRREKKGLVTRRLIVLRVGPVFVCKTTLDKYLYNNMYVYAFARALYIRPRLCAATAAAG